MTFSSSSDRNLTVWESKYVRFFGQPDPRTNQWIFVRDHQLPFFVMTIYILCCISSKYIMKNVQPFCLKYPMLLYNFTMVVLNGHITYELLICCYKLKYPITCEDVNYQDTSECAIRIAKACWWYFVSKYIEILDTVFFIARKKFSQISFLHVFHHSTMLINWWLGTKYYAGGHFVFIPLINSFIHVVMYSYYGLTTLGPSVRPFLWWKKHLTTMQLAQFVLIALHNAYPLFYDCKFSKPLFMVKIVVAYQVILILLFGNFYIQSYLKREKKD